MNLQFISKHLEYHQDTTSFTNQAEFLLPTLMHDNKHGKVNEDERNTIIVSN